ncbi:NAD-dependent epimerase/dehydratase [Anaeromyxobacter sp. K]|uniref:SDR family oxidoreductase n=1 Tax=Anaeromyxobacter sp. (strain K) TaxID=447217 RepID=UPI00017BE424|nr:SDR family oxidoreductase [Anaeromyxobacter sp. K]ACG75623.1 NAD-dependent epimerase/dehydratase [Anaeromyxobacter sp. K]
MQTTYDHVCEDLRAAPRRWLVTGGAGFIGSHLVQKLLSLRQDVIVLDDLSTGHLSNLDDATKSVREDLRGTLTFIKGDIRDLATCLRACAGVDLVLHQAALGSVPRSLKDPRTSHDVNVTGAMNVFLAARDSGARRLVYASSSSVYGDHPALPKVEDQVGKQLSPYAVTKYANELYAHVFGQAYGLELIGLRYFNVFGPRQDPNGPYAAVMPQWFAGLLSGTEVVINGDGETTRDFCYVANAVQANLLAATTSDREAVGRTYNVACGAQTSLNTLFELIRTEVARVRPEAANASPAYKPFRPGDIRHSLANVDRARALLGYVPTHDVAAGLREAAAWYASLRA